MWRFQNVRAYSSHVSTKQAYENNTLPHQIQKKSILSIPSAIKESKEIFLTTEFKMSFLPGEFTTEKKFLKGFFICNFPGVKSGDNYQSAYNKV